MVLDTPHLPQEDDATTNHPMKSLKRNRLQHATNVCNDQLTVEHQRLCHHAAIDVTVESLLATLGLVLPSQLATIEVKGEEAGGGGSLVW